MHLFVSIRLAVTASFFFERERVRWLYYRNQDPKPQPYFPFPKLSDTLICGVVLAILLLKLVLKAVMSWHRKDTFFGTPFPWQTEGDSC